MKIRTKFLLMFITVVASVAGIFLVLVDSFQKIESLLAWEARADLIASQVFRMSSLTNEYMTQGTDRAVSQWRDTAQSLLRHIEDYSSIAAKPVGLRNVVAGPEVGFSVAALNSLDDSVNGAAGGFERMIQAESDPELSERLGLYVSVRLSEAHEQAENLMTVSSNAVIGQVEKTIEVTVVLLSIVMLVFLAGGLMIFMMTSWRITDLIKSASDVTEGEGSFRVSGIVGGSDDELAALARVIESTLGKLKDQRDNLERMVKERTDEIRRARVIDEAVLRSVADGLIFLDRHQRVAFMNGAAERMLAITETEAMGQLWEEVCSVVDSKGNAVESRKTIVSRVAVSEFGDPVSLEMGDDIYYTGRNGHRFPVAATAARVMAGEEELGVVLSFRDVTKEKEVDRAKSDFVALASHQLRTPLTGINWYTEALLNGDKGRLNKGQQKYLTVIHESNDRMVRLVKSLLNVARIEMGTLMVMPVPVDLRSVIQEELDRLLPQVKDSKVRVEVEVADNVPKTVSLDKDQIHVVVQNLLTNAVKYSGENGLVKVELRLMTEDDLVDGQKVGAGRILLSVIDHGIGIPLSQQERVFEKLFRADNVVKVDTDGSGLGLYIVKSIVKRYGCKVWFASIEGQGTRVHLTLPSDGVEEHEGTKTLVT